MVLAEGNATPKQPRRSPYYVFWTFLLAPESNLDFDITVNVTDSQILVFEHNLVGSNLTSGGSLGIGIPDGYRSSLRH